MTFKKILRPCQALACLTSSLACRLVRRKGAYMDLR